MNNPKDMLVIKPTAHMCRMDHEEIWYNGSEHELCPLCRLRSERDELVDMLYEAAGYADEVTDSEGAEDFAKRARALYAKHKPE